MSENKKMRPEIIKNDDGYMVQVSIPKEMADTIYNNNKDTEGFNFNKSLLVCSAHEIIAHFLIDSKDYLSFFYAAFMIQLGVALQIEHVLKLFIHESSKQESSTETVQ